MNRNSRADVVEAAGRLFADRGYHGTSMRDLARELGLRGSSLYSHVSSKEDLLVEVIEKGAGMFQRSAESALATSGTAAERLARLVAGHIGLVIDNPYEVRTFLNEARSLDHEHRSRVVAARDRYEEAFRAVLSQGMEDGSFHRGLDVKLTTILILSIVNAVDRWYHPDGRLDRQALTEQILSFATDGIG